MRLTDLEPTFLKWESEGSFRRDVSSDKADGIMFLHPADFVKNGGPVGTTHIICWFRDRVPDTAMPGTGRWVRSGSDFAGLSLHPSVAVDGWHGWVKNGQVN